VGCFFALSAPDDAPCDGSRRHHTSCAAADSTAGESHETSRLSSTQQLSARCHGLYTGLLWHDGGFYESTGLEGHSTLRRVEFPSGRVLQKTAVPSPLFAEGLALVGERLVQLTWKSRRGLVYDRKTLKPISYFQYETEGWGLTFDGKNLIMSDGSDTLFYLDKDTYQPVRRLRVTLDGQPVDKLNELEWIEGEVWANVWQTDLVMRIDPTTGRVRSIVDLSGLLPLSQRSGQEDVLNGIAYDPEKKRIFVTGKLWPRLFEIQVNDSQ
jgi:glutamine cyclotransferase